MEILFDIIASGKQRGRAAANGGIELSHGYLVKIAIVKPDALAVPDDQLFVRLLVYPAEFSGTLELHGAACCLHYIAVSVENGLREICADSACIPHEALETADSGCISYRSK